MNRLVWIACTLLIAVAGCTASQQTTSPDYSAQPDVLAVIDGSPITVDEYEQRYVRSVGSLEEARDDSMAAYRDFLDRYVNFRLKVRAARDAGYEQDSTLRAEIQDYRMNLGRPFLMEEEVLDPIIRDLYDKSQELVDVSHILIRVAPDAAPADTAAAWETITTIRDSVVAGADFADMARRRSQDPSARMEGRPGFEGHLGVIGAGRVIKNFEDEMYATPAGEVSPAFRTQYGYHILKVHDRVPARPERRISHILIRPDAQTDEARQAALEEARALKQQLASGADFAELAREHSEDPGSAQRGGDLNFIGYDAPLVAPFKEAAFALEETGDVSDIVETQYGYHLIKLTDEKELPSYEEAYEDLKKRAQRLPRMREAQDALVEEAYARRHVDVDTTLIRTVFSPLEAEAVLTSLQNDDLGAYSDSVFATLGDSTYTFAELASFTRAQQRRSPLEGSSVERALQLIEPFMSDRAMTYEVVALEDDNEEFAAIMREFRDGLLLFRVMEDSVWAAASQDTTGLQRYYEAHREEYRFPERTVVVSFTSSDDSLLTALGDRLDAGTSLASLAAELEADSTQRVRLDTTYLAGPTDSVYDQALELDEGERTQPVRHQRRYVMLLNQGVEAPRAKTFAEARAEVTSAYQEIVEAELIQRLRDRYGVTTYPDHLVNVFDQAATPTSNASPAGSAASE